MSNKQTLDRLIFFTAGIGALLASWIIAGIIQPTVFSQSRFVMGIPTSFPERISYPAAGVSGMPPCNSRTNGKTYLFDGSLYTSATCDGATGLWDHYYGGIPVIPIDPANFTTFNGGPETLALVGGMVQLSAPALAGINLRVRAIPYPATPFTMTIGFTSDIVGATAHGNGLAIFDQPVTQVRTFLNYTLNTNQYDNIIAAYTTFTGPAAVVTGVTQPGWGFPNWIRYSDTGVTRTWAYNRIGNLPQNTTASWHLVLSEASGTGVVPEHIGFFINVENAACPLTTQFIHCDIDGQPCQ